MNVWLTPSLGIQNVWLTPSLGIQKQCCNRHSCTGLFGEHRNTSLSVKT